MKITLTKPPALNALYGNTLQGGRYLKPMGKAWKESTAWLLKATREKFKAQPLKFWVNLYTCRHQDNDSVSKLLQDTFQYAGIIVDDYWLFDTRVIKHIVPIKEERIEIDIEELSHQLRGGE